MSGSRTIFEAQDICASWEGAPVIEHISFTLDEGQIICLIGRSGSGKTTLFHALAGLSSPEAGKVLLDGVDITSSPGHVSYMLQKDLLLDHRTIIGNVCLPLLIQGVPKKEAESKALSLFATFGLEGSENAYPRQLSGGMRQRAALMRTYLSGAPVMLMDEPFSALDALTREDMRAWFLRVADKLALSSIIVTHDINEAMALADTILVLGPACKESPLPSTIRSSLTIDVPRSERTDFLMSAEAATLRGKLFKLLEDTPSRTHTL